MPLLCYNLTTSPITLAAGNPTAPVIPASAVSHTRGLPVNVTGYLSGLSGAQYAAIQAQSPRALVFEWLGAVEYSTPGLRALQNAPYNNRINVKDFGAIGYDGTDDDTAAFQAAIDYVTALYNTPTQYNYMGKAGAEIYIPPGIYRISSTLHLRTQISLIGAGGFGFLNNNTVLVFRTAANNAGDTFDGIVVESTYDTNGAVIDSGEGSVISSFRMLGGGGTYDAVFPPTPSINEDEPLITGPAHTGHAVLAGNAIVLKTRATVSHVMMDTWQYDGVHIDTTGDPLWNANGFLVEHSNAINMGRHGFYVNGENGNAGTFINCVATAVAGYGFYERSFLGNSYIGCWTEENGRAVTDVRAMLVDPLHSNALMVGSTDGGVLRSCDAAVTTETINLGLYGANNSNQALSGRNWPVLAMAIDPSYLYAACGKEYSNIDAAGVYRIGAADKDGWPQLNPWVQQISGLTDLDVRALVAFTDSAIDYVFAGGSTGGVFKSTDHAGTWAASNTGLTNLAIFSLTWDSVNTTLYAGTNGGGLFKSSDHGATWSATTALTGTAKVHTVLANNGTVFVGTDDGFIYKSVDSGATWTQVLTQANPVYQIIYAQSGTSTVFAVAGLSGFYKSVDSGATWTQSNSGLLSPNLTTIDARCIAVDPVGTANQKIYIGANGNRVYTTYNPGGVFYSSDGGATWAEAGNGQKVYYGGGYFATANSSAFVGCYSEADQRDSIPLPSIRFGGTVAGWEAVQPGELKSAILSGNGIQGLTLNAGVNHRPKFFTPTTTLSSGAFGDSNFMIVDASGANGSVQLPDPTNRPGQILRVMRTDSTINALSVVGTVDGIPNFPILYPLNTYSFLSTGSAWTLIGDRIPWIKGFSHSTIPAAGGNSAADGKGALVYNTDKNAFQTTTLSAASNGLSNNIWHPIPQVQAQTGATLQSSPYDPTVGEQVLATTSPTYVASYTPPTQWLFEVKIYLRVVTAATNVTVTLTYTDGSGAQTVTVLPLTNLAVDVYNFMPIYINATSAPIGVQVTAGTANQVYASAEIVSM